MTVTVPRGALAQTTTITMTARAGTVVAYDFAPHGITFAKPLVFQQQLRGTNASLLTAPLLQLGYYSDAEPADEDRRARERAARRHAESGDVDVHGADLALLGVHRVLRVGADARSRRALLRGDARRDANGKGKGHEGGARVEFDAHPALVRP